jgi:hypothetical protein
MVGNGGSADFQELRGQSRYCGVTSVANALKTHLRRALNRTLAHFGNAGDAKSGLGLRPSAGVLVWRLQYQTFLRERLRTAVTTR